MISILFLYSPDRKQVFLETLSCLNDLELFADCQKIVCVDNKNNLELPSEYEIEIVARKNGQYCWANAINAGIARSHHSIFLYLDCDRILPRNYLTLCLENIGPKKVLYSEQIYKILNPLPASYLKILRDDPNNPIFLVLQERLPHPMADYGMTPFSGNTCMLKQDYLKSGGFDPRFRGYGFPDIDYFFTTEQQGFQFIKLPGTTELHQYHEYPIMQYRFIDENTWNAYQLCKKWKLTPSETMAAQFEHNKIDLNAHYWNIKECFANRKKRLFL